MLGNLFFDPTYLSKHLISVITEIRVELSSVCQVQILLHEAGCVNLIIAGLVQHLNRFYTVCFDCLNLLDEIAAFLLTSLLVAHRLYDTQERKMLNMSV